MKLPWTGWIPGVLSKSQIKELWESGLIVGEGSPDKALDQSAVDLTLSGEAFKMAKGSVKPPGSLAYGRFIEKEILVGSKSIEIRKRFSRKWTGCKAMLYSSRPVSALVGEVTIGSVTYGRPTDIWAAFESHLDCSYEEFQEYVGSSTQVSAIELKDVTPYEIPVNLRQISHLLNQNLRQPQSYCDLRLPDDNAWTMAASVASLLSSKFGHAQPFLGWWHKAGVTCRVPHP